MEPERNIEKLLRACAKKRRAEPGATPELHPATRRLLQAEAARRAPRPEREGFSFLRFLGECRPGLSAVLGVFVVAVLGGALLLPSLGKAKSKAQSVAAMSNLKQIGLAASLFADDHTNRLPVSLAELKSYNISSNVCLDPASRKPFVYVGAGKNRDALAPDAPLAYSPEERQGRAVLFADGSVRRLTGRQFAELADQNALQLAAVNEDIRKELSVTTGAGQGAESPVPASVSAPAQSLPAPAAGEVLKADVADLETEPRDKAKAERLDYLAAAGVNRQQFVRVDAEQKKSADDFKLPKRPASVLASFQVRQSGGNLQVVDADGSIYLGYLQMTNAGVANQLGAAEKPAEEPAAVRLAPEARGKGTDLETGRNYFFRVSGTNRLLKQNVLFTGNLMFTNAARLAQDTDTGAAAANPLPGLPADFQLPLGNSRISGTAVINDREEIPILALPAAR